MSEKPEVSALLPDDEAIASRRRALEAALRPHRRRRRVPWRLVAVAAALLVLGGGGAWAAGVFSAKEIAVGAGVGCYEKPSLHASAAIFRSAADPVAKCARLWREGVLGVTLSREEEEGKIRRRDGAVPHLVACSAEDKPVSVFPGGDGLCDRLGLQPLPADYALPGREVARAYTAWDRVLMRRIRVEPGQCPAPGPIAERARRLLRDAGYGDVPVRVSAEGPCAQSVESRGRVIAVLTRTPREDRVAHLAGEAFTVLAGLFERASLNCIAPERFGTLARQALDGAGLDQVRVGLSQRLFPCAYGTGGFSLRKLEVEIGASDRKTWRSNRAGFLRHQHRLGKRQNESSR